MEWTPDPEHPLRKVCTKCGREKHLMEFYLDYQSGRRRPRCKACERAYTRRYYAEHLEHCRARSRQWYADNDDRGRANARDWYAANRARHREQGRKWAQQHPEQVRAMKRRYARRYPGRERVRQVSRGLVRLGLIEVGDRCTDCGSPDFELHHPDYSDPFRVVPLCHRCHMARHWAEWRGTGGGR